MPVRFNTIILTRSWFSVGHKTCVTCVCNSSFWASCPGKRDLKPAVSAHCLSGCSTRRERSAGCPLDLSLKCPTCPNCPGPWQWSSMFCFSCGKIHCDHSHMTDITGIFSLPLLSYVSSFSLRHWVVVDGGGGFVSHWRASVYLCVCVCECHCVCVCASAVCLCQSVCVCVTVHVCVSALTGLRIECFIFNSLTPTTMASWRLSLSRVTIRLVHCHPGHRADRRPLRASHWSGHTAVAGISQRVRPRFAPLSGSLWGFTCLSLCGIHHQRYIWSHISVRGWPLFQV